MAKAQALATAFGGMSAAIGAWYAIAPRHFLQTIGARPNRRRIVITELVAAQELMVGTSLAADGRAARWLTTRVAGDVLHAGMLALAYRAPDADKSRMRLAFGALAAITAADVAATMMANGIERSGVDSDEATGSSTEAAKLTDGTIRRSITINRSPEDVYAFWRQLDNLPQFMKHLERVDVLDTQRSHWVAKAPLGTKVEWDAEMTADEPGRRISWQSTDTSAVWNSGEVTFAPAPAGRGTEVHVRLEYAPPGGMVGSAIARILGEEPSTQISGDLRRLKQVLETGEVVVSDATADGRSRRQRPAQAIPVAA